MHKVCENCEGYSIRKSTIVDIFIVTGTRIQKSIRWAVCEMFNKK